MPRDWLHLLLAGAVVERAQVQSALESLCHESADKKSFCLFQFSIDRFRLINHRFGPACADEVLRRVGTATKQFIQRRGIVGRWGADEFLGLLPGVEAEQSYQIVEQLRSRLASLVIPVGTGVTTITCSVGVACYPECGTDLNTLLAAADEALYEAKHSGRNRIIMASRLRSPVHQLATLVESALREERLLPPYQPIIEIETGRLVGEEAMARLLTVDDRTLEASEFIDAAAELGLTYKVDCAIISAALARYAASTRDGKPPCLFVNISADLLRHPQALCELLDAARTGDAKGKQALVVEITERELLGKLDIARDLLAPFIDRGLRLALDDFGFGYSSFEYLADLPVSFLKIDGRLVQRLHESRVRAIVGAIQRTADELALITLAEGVEQERQASILRDIGVPWAQGYYYGPARMDEKEASIRRRLSVNWMGGIIIIVLVLPEQVSYVYGELINKNQ